MTMWAKAQLLQNAALEQIRGIYGEHFPIEVRHFLAAWIDDKNWTDIDLENPQHEIYANNLVTSLISELEEKVNLMGSTQETFISRLKLLEAIRSLKISYSQNSIALFQRIQNCLREEMRIVLANDPMGPKCENTSTYNQNASEIMRELETLRLRVQDTNSALHKLDNDIESFNLSYHECTKYGSHLEHLKTQEASTKTLNLKRELERQKHALEQSLRERISSLLDCRIQLADTLKETCYSIENTQSRILNVELLKWKREQQLQGNGATFHCNLDVIQNYCESLAEIIWTTRHQIKEAERLKSLISKYVDPPNIDILPGLNAQITQCLSHLVTSTFIIEKQPPQVMKTNTKFMASVRLLTGSKLNVYMTPPQVKAQIICESQAVALLKNEKISKGDASGEILNNTGVMEYHAPSKILNISLRNMQLKKIKRAEKRGTESVMDEKFSLYFSSQFSIGGGELVFQVWTLSLPVVVIVHGNQEPHAHATITWDNAFAEPGRSPFTVPDSRPWPLIAEVLNMKFESCTGRSLNAECLNFLAEKAFKAQYADYSNMSLTWQQFCKDPLPDRAFTFWEWFYAALKLTREYLKQSWTEGHIMGFVRKKQAEEMLRATRVNGTFLLRFSDSELGGITFAYLQDEQVYMISPFTGNDFKIRKLADRISDLSPLVYLYPDKPKDIAFGKHYSSPSERIVSGGYVVPWLVTQVPTINPTYGVGNGMRSYPLTPQIHPNSPTDVTRETHSVASVDSNYPNGVEGNPSLDYNIFNEDLPEFSHISEVEQRIDFGKYM